jgi:Icc-related predicted phosphoesterase
VSAPLRIAAVGDIHCREGAHAELRSLLAGVEGEADVLLLAGDLTMGGLPAEAESVVRALASLHLPKVAVLGNHDFDHGRSDEIARILHEGGLTVLAGDENTLELDRWDAGIVGAKGFCGGFGAATLAPFGERAVKAFVDESVHEALLVEVGLRKLGPGVKKVVALHYAPIKETCAGEPFEIYPFLGSSRFAETIDRFGATVVFHGHAHHGTLAGKTPAGIAVYNVALPVVRKALGRGYLVREV